MKKILFLMLLSIMCFPLHALEGTVVKIGAYELRPHMFSGSDNKHIDGTLIKFLQKEVIEGLNLKSELVFHPFSRAMLEIEKGSIDLLGFIAKNQEREKFLVYPKTPIFKTSSVLIFRRDRVPAVMSTEKLQGLVIGHTQGSIVPDFLKNKGIKFSFLAGDHSLERNLEKLKRKRIDGVFAPTQSHAENIIQNLGLEKQLISIPLQESELILYVAISKKLNIELRENILKKLDAVSEKYAKEYYKK